MGHEASPGPLERPQPPESVAGGPFWAASRDQRLVLPWCPTCEVPHWYPRGFCPSCLGTEIDWRESEGDGTVHAVSIQPRAPHPGLADRAPYAVALVDLDDGVRMMLGITGSPDPASVAIGDRVRIGWEALADGRHLPVAQLSPTDQPED